MTNLGVGIQKSPEGPKIDNSGIDQEARSNLLSGDIFFHYVKSWRKSANLSRKDLSILTGYSIRHLARIENGYVPISDEFGKVIRQLVQMVDSGLEYIPPGIIHYVRPPKDVTKYVAVRNVVGKGHWGHCPVCDPNKKHPKLFTSAQQVYCSKKCKRRASRSRHAGTNSNPKFGNTIYTRCPSCGAEYPNSRKYHFRKDTNPSQGSAENDPPEQVVPPRLL